MMTYLNRAYWRVTCMSVALTLFVFPVLIEEGGARAAQSPSDIQGMPIIAHQFVGVWVPDFQTLPRGNCGGLVDENGLERQACSVPVDRLLPLLNARARAYLEWADERAQPAYDCADLSVPALAGDVYSFTITALEDMFLYYHDTGVMREWWMDGRSPPRVGSLFHTGYSIGHWDGDVLVIEATNFTFDQQGYDDHTHFPSSVQKRVTERYEIVETGMRVTITVADPLFLTGPFTFEHYYKRPDGTEGLPMEWAWECDPRGTRGEVEASYPNKYPD